MKHTDKCLSQQEEILKRYNEYVALWPNYCKTCGGTGERTWYENYDGLGGELLSEYCSCVLNNVCPRCGMSITWEDVMDEPNCCEYCDFTVGGEGCPPKGLEEPCECEMVDNYEAEEAFLREF